MSERNSSCTHGYHSHFFPNVPIYGEMVSLKYFFSYPENRRICEPGNKLIEYYNIAWAASNLEKSNMSKRVKLKKKFQPPRIFFDPCDNYKKY